MTLIKSTSGIRGIIGGRPNLGLTPLDIVKYTAAFGQWTLNKTGISRIVIGRDARLSGEMVRSLVVGTLQALGIDVIDLGLTTTPTLAMAVPLEKAGGAISLSASHYPKEWNALKLLDQRGEVMNVTDGAEVGALTGSNAINFSEAGRIGKITSNDTYLARHIEAILRIPSVDTAAIRAADFEIAVDGVNSVGGIAVPQLLRALGVQTIHPLFCDPDGDFGHDPDLLPDHLFQLSAVVTAKKADMGIAIDPDVNRLSIFCEDGLPFGDEYLLVAIADHVLKHKPGNIVGTSAPALSDLAANSGYSSFTASPGEAGMIEAMKSCHAVVGGDANGGIIYPGLHYGRDALAGIALFLSHVAREKVSLSHLKDRCPPYYMAKSKVMLADTAETDRLLDGLREKYGSCRQNNIDGLRICFEDGWVHLAADNAEPQLWAYTGARSQKEADALAARFQNEMEGLLGRGRSRLKAVKLP